jgi:hypothetical protein
MAFPGVGEGVLGIATSPDKRRPFGGNLSLPKPV